MAELASRAGSPLRGTGTRLDDYSSHMRVMPPGKRFSSMTRTQVFRVVDEAMQGRPAVITRHGKRQAVVVSHDEWERLSHVPTFGRLLMATPPAADDLPKPTALGKRSIDRACTSSRATHFGFRAGANGFPRTCRMDRGAFNLADPGRRTVVEIEDGDREIAGVEGRRGKARDLASWLETVLHLYGRSSSRL